MILVSGVIDKEGRQLGGTLKPAATMSHYCSAARAAQPPSDSVGNSGITAAVRNPAVSVCQAHVVYSSNYKTQGAPKRRHALNNH